MLTECKLDTLYHILPSLSTIQHRLILANNTARKREEKFFKIFFKKVLTNNLMCGIICKSPRKADMEA